MQNEWTIYDKSGAARAVVGELEYHGEWMGEEFVTVTVKSPTPVSFATGDYIDYREIRFYIDYDPSVIKVARPESYGEAFTYENVKLYTKAHELTFIMFKDYVKYGQDSNKAYSQQTKFSFFASSVQDLAYRIEANLDGYGSYWSFDVNVPADSKKDVNVSVDGISCWDALKLSYDMFGVDFIVTCGLTSGTISIGHTHQGVNEASTIGEAQYGKGKGLFQIEKNYDDSQKIVTKLYAYGSSDNLPRGYYFNKDRYAFFEGMPRKETSIYAGNLEDYFYNTSVAYSDIEHAIQRADTKCSLRSSNGYTCEAFLDTYNDNDGSVSKLCVRLSTTNRQQAADFFEYGSQPIVIEKGVNVNAWPDIMTRGGDASLLSVGNLMLPGFHETSLSSWVSANRSHLLNLGYTFSEDPENPWIKSPLADKYGVREGAIYFDGTGDYENIMPSITATSGANVVRVGSTVKDNGYIDDNKSAAFTIGVGLGIDWGEIYDNRQDDIYIKMTSGLCSGRSFKLLSTPKVNDGVWVLKLERSKDSSMERYFPYNDYQIRGSVLDGDTFVATGLQLPEEYVIAAAEKMFDAAIEALKSIDHPKVAYIPKFDEIAVARDFEKVGNKSNSIYHRLRPGLQLHFKDADLVGSNELLSKNVETVTIHENGNNGLPTFDVTLRDEVDDDLRKKIRNEVSSMIGGSSDSSSKSSTVTDSDDNDGDLENNVNVDWFSELFELWATQQVQAKDDQGKGIVDEHGDPVMVTEPVQIPPNKWPADPTKTPIIGIKAKYGVWTDFFLSALGKNGDVSGGGGGASLNEPLLSINNSGLAAHPSVANQTIVWDGTKWCFGTAGGGGGGSTFDESQMWAALLGQNGTQESKQIDKSHLLSVQKQLFVKNGNTIVGTYSPVSELSIDFAAGTNIEIDTDTSLHKLTIRNTYSYQLPTASADTLGGVKVGSTLSIAKGVLNLKGNIIANPGLYTKVKIDQYGRVTEGLNPNTLADYGITDAGIANGVITLGTNTITPVTKVTMTVPTGFAISGSPVTKDGTLALSYDSGYEGFKSDWKDMILALYSWFEVDGNGDIKTKDYKVNGQDRHRGFYSPSFVSALGKNGDTSQGVGIDWDSLITYDGDSTHKIHPSYLNLTGYATQDWVTQQLSGSTYTHPTGNPITVTGKLLTGITVNNLGHVVSVGYKDSLDFNDLPTLYWANVPVTNSQSITTQPTFKNITLRDTNGDSVTLEYKNGGLHVVGGMWADSFVSALGMSGDTSQTIVASLNDLTDVVITSPLTTGQVLKYNGTNWVNGEDQGVTTLAWSQITDKPTKIAEFGITDVKIQNGTIIIGSNSITPLTSFTETDPTVPSWAKQPNKPSYTFGELTSHPDTLTGYGISANDQLFDSVTVWKATRLADNAAKTAWGRTYWQNGQPQTVSGNMTDVGSITMSGDVRMARTSNGIQFKLGSTDTYTTAMRVFQSSDVLSVGYETAQQSFDTNIYGKNVRLFYGVSTDLGLLLNNSGNVGIGTGSPAEKLDVNGNIKTSSGNGSYIKIGGLYIIYDDTNNALKVSGSPSLDTHVAANFYATGGVSALGLSDDTTPATFDESQMWDALAKNEAPYLNSQIHSGHLTNALSGYVKSENIKTLTINGTIYNPIGSQNQSVTISTDRLGQYALADGASLATFTHSTDLIYTAKGGSNTNTDKPTGVTAFGIISMKVAQGYYGQLLVSTNGDAYLRASNSLQDVAWKKIAFTDSAVAKADTWATARNFSIASSDNTGAGAAVSVNGSQNVTLLLPSTIKASLTGNASTATKLAASKKINGTSFDGSQDITTAKWGSSRTITVKDNDSSHSQSNSGIDGSDNFTLLLPATIKASITGNVTGNLTGNVTGNVTGNLYGNADTATTASKLSVTNKSLWGNTYWTSGGVPTSVGYDEDHKASLNYVNNITMSGNLTLGGLIHIGGGYLRWSQDTSEEDGHPYAGGRNVLNLYSWDNDVREYRDILIGTYIDAFQYGGLYFRGSNWAWGIGTDDPMTKLDVNGGVKATKFYLHKPYDDDTDAVYLQYISNQGGVKLVGAGFYTDSYVSALGLNDDTSPIAFDESEMWKALGTNITDKKISQSYLSNVTKNLTVTVNGHIYSYNGTSAVDLGTIQVTGDYLPLTGGTLRSENHQVLELATTNSAANKWVGLKFKYGTAGNETTFGGICMNETDNSLRRYTSAYVMYKLWDEGNDGTGSGLDADLLDGQHGSYYATASSVSTLQGYFSNGSAKTAEKLNDSVTRKAWGNIYWQNGKPVATDITSSLYLANAKGINFRNYADSENVQLLGFDASNNALLGNLSYSTSLRGSNINFKYGDGNTLAMIINSSGNVGIGTNSPSYKLSVSGDIQTTGQLNMARGNGVSFDIDGTYTKAMRLFVNSNVLGIGYETTVNKSFDTNIYGNNVSLFYGSSQTLGVILTSGGNVGIGYSSPTDKLYVNGTSYFADNSHFEECVGIGGAPNNSYKLYVNGNSWMNGKLGVGTTTDSTYRLKVSGLSYLDGAVIPSSKTLTIGSAVLEWDDDNNALKVRKSTGANEPVNLYATGGVSALGIGSDSGGGASGDYIPLTGSTLISGELTPSQGGINLGSTQMRWNLYATSVSASQTISAPQITAQSMSINGNTVATTANLSNYLPLTIPNGGKTVTMPGINSAVTFKNSTGYPLIRFEGGDEGGLGFLGFLKTNKQPYFVTVDSGGTYTDGVSKWNVLLHAGNYTTYCIAKSFNGSQSISASENVSIIPSKNVNIAAGTGGSYDVSITAAAGKISMNAAGIYLTANEIKANGNVISGSDMRMKDVIENISLDVEDIARSPLFNFSWKDRAGKIYTGTSAQYWQKVLPYAAQEGMDGMLGLDYAGTALAAAISVARKTLTHEEEIKRLKAKVAELETEVEQLKAA